MERRLEQKRMGVWKRMFKKRFLATLLIAGTVLALCGLLTINIFIWKSDVSQLEKPAPQPTIIYDQNGEIASKISNSRIEGVSMEQIPEEVIHAVIATEDQHFYKHHGLNYFGILRALTQNITSGEIVAGGSTITQQLAKNVFLSHERTYTRKVKEFILTKKIERTYSKDEIIERYLNQIYFGEGAWGIQTAAKTYFGKDVSQLTLSESAILAGLIKAPSALSPIKNAGGAIERRDVVLALMEKEGYITNSEAEQAKSEGIVLRGQKPEDEYKGKYPYYVDHIIDEAIKKYGLTENEVLSGGFHIYTELNPVIQRAVEEVYKNDELFPTSPTDQLVQSGGIFINPQNGGIQALVGGRGEHTFRGFNHATQLIRQPGSTMKPLSVYTPALERGYEIYDWLEDQPLNLGGYQPNNYDHQFRGQVTMYDAMIHSYNVPAVWLLNKLGVDDGINAVERFGIPLEEEDRVLGLALGGMSKGTSPLRMAQAYATFANDGLMVEAHAIQKIEDVNGEPLGEWREKAVRVTEPEVAQKITYMLKGVVDEGTGRKAQVEGIESAGKTGTTQLPFANEQGAKDAWFVGYTPELVGAIWLGYDVTDQKHYLPSTAGGIPTALFQQIVSRSASELSETTFDFPFLSKKYEEQIGKAEKEKEKMRKAEERAKKAEDKKRKKEAKQREKEEKKKKKEEEKRKKKEEKEREKEARKREKDEN